ncbi:MAG: hypothetical protein JXR58_02460 [Bacteroidales bacterium]|nr:hypothetical protein [Bacteroidales bacterium]
MKSLLSAVFFIIVLSGFSQDYNSFLYSNKNFEAADSGSLKFRINTTSFFKNNEYFNYITEGYTNIGYFVQPSLVYTAFPNLQFEAGGHFLSFSGLNKFHQTLPVFRAHYTNHKGFHFVMGTIYGTLNHKLIEPIYRFENYIEKNTENGIQLIFDKKFFNLDIWVDWEQFIFQNDINQEHISGGYSGSINLLKLKDIEFSIPFQSTIYHEGGQVDLANKSDLLLVNTASGLTIEKKNNNGFIKSISLSGFYLTYGDFSDEQYKRYKNGNAVFSNVFIKTLALNFFAGYWSGHKYISTKGEPLFNAVSQMYTTYFEPDKDLLLLKFIYERNLYKGVLLGVRLETYYGLIYNKTDFSYGVHLVFDRDFFIGKEKR